MAINTITSESELKYPNQDVQFVQFKGKYKYDFYGYGEQGGIFVAVLRGGQNHDRDRLSLLLLERFDCKERGIVYRWKDTNSAWGFGYEEWGDGGWESAIAKGIKTYGGVVYHLSDPMVDMITLLQNCVQNNLSLKLAQVEGFNFGRTPVQKK